MSCIYADHYEWPWSCLIIHSASSGLFLVAVGLSEPVVDPAANPILLYLCSVSICQCFMLTMMTGWFTEIMAIMLLGAAVLMSNYT